MLFYTSATNVEESLSFVIVEIPAKYQDWTLISVSVVISPQAHVSTKVSDILVDWFFFLSADLKLWDYTFLRICLKKHFIAFEIGQNLCTAASYSFESL